MRIPEKVVADVVQDASLKMSDPRYAQTLVGTFVQAQRSATEYVKAHVRELGGAEQVVSTIFHAALLSSCFLRHAGRSPRQMSFEELDRAASGERDERLKKVQPALWDYLVANVESDEMRRVLIVLVLGMDYVF